MTAASGHCGCLTEYVPPSPRNACDDESAYCYANDGYARGGQSDAKIHHDPVPLESKKTDGAKDALDGLQLRALRIPG